MDRVWVVYDYEDLVAVAATEELARRAAEAHTSAQIDKKYFGPETHKRFQWGDNDPHKTGKNCWYLSVWGRPSAHGSPMQWCGTGVTVEPEQLLAAPVTVFVVVSDCGLNGIDVHGVYSTRPDDATVRAFIGTDAQGNATSAGPRVSGTGGYGGTDIVEFVLDADLK